MVANPVALLHHLRRLTFRSPTGDADARLLERFVRCRDQKAFAVLVARHGPMVLRVCRRTLADSHAAEDAFQATFLVLARRAAGLRQPQRLAGWLHGVAYRVALKARKVASLRRGREVPSADLAQPDPHPDPLAQLTARELLSVVDEEVQRLPEAYRLPVLLCCLEGHTLEEAARLLNESPGSVRGRLERGRARLRERLARRGLTLPAALAAVAIGQGALGLPGALAGATVRAAAAFAESGDAAVIPARVLALAEEGLNGMATGKVKIVAALVLLAAGLIGGVCLAAHQPPTPPPGTAGEKIAADAPGGERQRRAEEEKRPRTDLHGDPLPAHALARFGTVRLRTGGEISQFAFSPDGKVLAAGSHDAAVSLWDVATGRELRRMEQATTDGLAFSPDGKILATGSGGEVRRWDTATWTELTPFRLSSSQAEHLTFSPDGKVLACLLREQRPNQNMILFLDAATGRELHRLEGLKFYTLPCFAFAPDSRTWAYADKKETTLRLADTRTGKEVRFLEGHSKAARTVTFSPDGKNIASTDLDDTLRFWDAATGKLLPQTGKFRAWVNLAYSPDGMLLAGSLRGPELYDLAQGKQLPAFGPGGNGEQPVLFSPDGKYLATAYQHSLRLWETATRKPVREIAGHEREVYAVAFAPDGRTIASTAGEFGLVHRWETATGKELPPWDSIQDGVYGLAYSADGRMLAVGTGNHDGTVWLLEPATGKLIRKLTIPKGYVTSVAFSADGRILASKYQARTHVWEVATGKLLCSQEGGPSIAEVALSPDGRTIAGASYEDGIIRLWEAATGKAVRQLGGHGRGVYAVAFSPDEKTLASGGHDKTVRLWDLTTGTQIWCVEGHENEVRWVAMSPDGKAVASGGGDRSVRLWEVATGKERQRFDGHRHGVRSGAFSTDNQRLATGSYDTTVLVWDLTGRAGKRPAEPLSSEDLTRFWNDLASEDAARAYHAIRALALDPGQTVPLLQEQLQPAAPVEAKRLGRLIADLDSEHFEVRQRASEELERVGEQAEPALRTALAGEPAPEARRRMERLLGKLVGPFTSLDQLRALRAVEVLESIGSTEARRVLEKLSERTVEARLAREAKAALGRLERRSATTP